MFWKCKVCNEEFEHYLLFCPACELSGITSKSSFYEHEVYYTRKQLYYQSRLEQNRQYSIEYNKRIKDPNYVGTKEKILNLILKAMKKTIWEELSEEQRLILTLKAVDKLTLTKISERLGKKVDSIYSYALQKIKKSK